MISKLNGNVIEHLRALSKTRGELEKYFHFDSKLWRAIRDHIADARHCVLIRRAGPVAQHRGTGPAISFEDAFVYCDSFVGKSNERVPSKFYCIKFRIEYASHDEDEPQAPRTRHSLDVPIELELNFSTAAFDRWVAGIAKEQRKDKRRATDLEKLDKLLQHYPADADKMLKKYTTRDSPSY